MEYWGRISYIMCFNSNRIGTQRREWESSKFLDAHPNLEEGAGGEQQGLFSETMDHTFKA